ncbi:MAG: methionyl-tRNA formyltransferase [Microcella sp.]|uniref:methionyl-tRNA formyltransferase n=1 Tax=Microcella sp. TaxID=1913979 RepID=UPI003315426D
MTALRIVFAGSPAAAVPTLRALAAGPHDLRTVITRPATAQGRKRILTPTPVAAEAQRLGVPVRETTRLHDLQAELMREPVDLGVIVAFGSLVREPLLSWPQHGWINLHFSLLPKWRGAAPVQHSLMAGEEETGATVFQLTPGLDDGEWFAQHRERVQGGTTAGLLLERLSGSGATLVAQVVDDIAVGRARARPQRGEVTLAPKLTRDDGRLEWQQDAQAVLARWRGVTPEPGAWTTIDQSQVVKLLELAPATNAPPLAAGAVTLDAGRVLVGARDTALELVRVQPAGKQGMPAADWARGWGDEPPRFR